MNWIYLCLQLINQCELIARFLTFQLVIILLMERFVVVMVIVVCYFGCIRYRYAEESVPQRYCLAFVLILLIRAWHL